MIEAQISTWTLARYWDDVVPSEFRIQSAAGLRRNLAATASKSPPLSVVIEIKKIVGPRTTYGLLGANYVPGDNKELCIQLCNSDPHNDLTSSLLPNETLYVGMPAWIASGIMDAVIDYAALLSHKAGILTFCYCAYSDVSSNMSIFQVLGKAVLDVTSATVGVLTTEQLAALLKRHLDR